MKKKLFALALASALGLSLLAGCGGKDSEAVTIKVGASPTPHAEILEVAKEILADENITLEIVPYDDYNLPNDNVEDGQLDANYFQHITYMNEYNESEGTHLVSVAELHYEPFGIYAGKTTSLADLADGADIAIPNDPTNGGRALLLLQEQGPLPLHFPAAGVANRAACLVSGVAGSECRQSAKEKRRYCEESTE